MAACGLAPVAAVVPVVWAGPCRNYRGTVTVSRFSPYSEVTESFGRVFLQQGYLKALAFSTGPSGAVQGMYGVIKVPFS